MSTIQLPQPIGYVPVPQGLADAVAKGALPIRVVVPVANGVQVALARPCIVVGFVLKAGAAQATAYLIDASENAAVAPPVETRKAPAVAAAGLTDGLTIPNPDVGLKMVKGAAFTCDQIDAEGFIFVLA